MRRLGTRLVMLCFTCLCPGWEISAFRAIVSHFRATISEFRVQTFQAQLDLQLVITDVRLLWGLSGLQVAYLKEIHQKEKFQKT